MNSIEIVAAVKAGARIKAHPGKRRESVIYALEKWHAVRGCWMESAQNQTALRFAAKQLTGVHHVPTGMTIYTA